MCFILVLLSAFANLGGSLKILRHSDSFDMKHSLARADAVVDERVLWPIEWHAVIPSIVQLSSRLQLDAAPDLS